MHDKPPRPRWEHIPPVCLNCLATPGVPLSYHTLAPAPPARPLRLHVMRMPSIDRRHLRKFTHSQRTHDGGT